MNDPRSGVPRDSGDAAESSVADLDGVRLRHVRLGAGRPLFVLGGIHLDHRYLRPWLDPLSGAAELVYLDPRGVGGSRPAGDEAGVPDLSDVDHATWVDDLVVLADELGHPRFGVLGHSYGGFLALEAALRHPGRVAGLVLCATAASMSHVELALERARARGTPGQIEALQEVLGGPAGDDATLRELWLEILPLYFHHWRPAHRAPFEEGVSYSAPAYDRAFFGCLPGYDVSDRLDEVDVPALVVSGRDDWIMPPEAAGRPLAEGLGAEHVVFEESGHFPFIEQPGAFAERVGGWLEGWAP